MRFEHPDFIFGYNFAIRNPKFEIYRDFNVDAVQLIASHPKTPQHD